jgi:hypothetical protein
LKDQGPFAPEIHFEWRLALLLGYIQAALSNSTSGSSGMANQLSASATRDNSIVPGAPVPTISAMQAAPPAPATVALNGLDAVVLAEQLANNTSSVTFVNVQSSATHVGPISVQHNSTDGGGTPEWAKRIMTEPQAKVDSSVRCMNMRRTQTRLLVRATTLLPILKILRRSLNPLARLRRQNKKAPSSAGRYTPPNPDNLGTAFESNSSSPK